MKAGKRIRGNVPKSRVFTGDDDYRNMRTLFGKKYGYEIQTIVFRRGRHSTVPQSTFHRLSWRNGGCREASRQELDLWRKLKKLKPELFVGAK